MMDFKEAFFHPWLGPSRRWRATSAPILFGLLSSFLSPAISKAQGEFQLSKPNRTVKVNFNFHRNLIVIPLMINDKGPFQFIFDTGVTFLIITNPDLPALLGQASKDSIMVRGLGNGKDIKAALLHQLTCQVGALRGQGFSAAVLPKDILEFSNYVGLPIDGIIGYDLARSFRVQIDYERKELTFSSPAKPFVAKGFDVIPISIENAHPYLNASVQVSSDHPIPVKLIVDTGAGHTLSLDQRTNPELKIPPVNLACNLGWGLNGPIEGRISRIYQLALPGIVFSNMICTFPSSPDSLHRPSREAGNGNIGNEILRRFLVVFDYSQSRLYLKKRRAFNAPFEYDMSGIGFTAEGTDFRHYIVSSVDENSPGQAAGLKPGDLFLLVNDNPVAEYSIADLDQLFRSGDRKKIYIVFLRAGKLYTVIMRLHRRI